MRRHLLHWRRRPRVYEPVHDVQLAQHRGREHEGVEMHQPHAAREFVEHGVELRPAAHELDEAGAFRVVSTVRAFLRAIVQHRRSEGLGRELHSAAVEAEALCGVQRVLQMQVVGSRLGPLFPRVAAGVSTDVLQRPIGPRALRVVALQRGAVVGPLIADEEDRIFKRPFSFSTAPEHGSRSVCFGL